EQILFAKFLRVPMSVFDFYLQWFNLFHNILIHIPSPFNPNPLPPLLFLITSEREKKNLPSEQIPSKVIVLVCINHPSDHVSNRASELYLVGVGAGVVESELRKPPPVSSACFSRIPPTTTTPITIAIPLNIRRLTPPRLGGRCEM
ncbi:hypothetical protein F2P56_035968, partial [Juglans regia]